MERSLWFLNGISIQKNNENEYPERSSNVQNQHERVSIVAYVFITLRINSRFNVMEWKLFANLHQLFYIFSAEIGTKVWQMKETCDNLTQCNDNDRCSKNEWLRLQLLWWNGWNSVKTRCFFVRLQRRETVLVAVKLMILICTPSTLNLTIQKVRSFFLCLYIKSEEILSFNRSFTSLNNIPRNWLAIQINFRQIFDMATHCYRFHICKRNHAQLIMQLFMTSTELKTPYENVIKKGGFFFGK